MLGQRNPSNKKTPPAKKQKMDSISTELKKAKEAGRDAARKGCTRPTIEQLITRKNYSYDQAVAYLESFDTHAGNENQQAIKKAKTAGSQYARQGFERPTVEQLIERNAYSQDQAMAYLDSFDTHAGDKNQQAIKKAKHKGHQQAHKSYQCPPIEQLIARNAYSQDQAIAHLDSFDKHAKDKNQQAIKKAIQAGYRNARRGSTRPTVEQLIECKYSQDQAIAYLDSFDKQVKDEHQQAIKKAQYAGYQKAHRGYGRPTVEQLIKRNAYSQEQAIAYLDSFDKYLIAKNKQINMTSSNNHDAQNLLDTHSEECSISSLLLAESDEDNFFIPGPFDLIDENDENNADKLHLYNQVSDTLFAKTSVNHNGSSSLHTLNINSREPDLTFLASLLTETEENNFFIPSPFDTLVNAEEMHPSNQISPLLFNDAIKTGSKHHPPLYLESAENIPFDLSERKN